MAADQWLTLKPQIDPASISVSIPDDGKPVVTFKVTDDKGNTVIGLGGQVAGTAGALPANYNLQFTLAKLVPADAAGNPSKWVSYLVTKPGTITAGAVTTWVGTYPTSDTNGTLVDNNDGTYKYTFLRSITAVKDQVAALIDVNTASNVSLKSDLGTPAELTYDPAATHRLGILVVGSQPGTGTNTPNKVPVVNPVPLANTFNIGYDFVPNGGALPATRDVVVKDSCTSCHDGRAIGHISTNNQTATTAATNGIPPGSFVGRNDPRLCVTCHTDQTKYGFPAVTTDATGNNYTSAYKRTVDGDSAFTFPRMVHQFHMGVKLSKTGYNLNGHCNNPSDTSGLYTATKPIANTAACYNTVGLPQAVTNCAVCHDGNTLKSDGKPNANVTKDGNNWMAKPSIVACGACHDGINFATGTGITAAETRVYQTAQIAYSSALTSYQTNIANGITVDSKGVTLVAPVAPVAPTGSGHKGGVAGKTNDTCATCHATGGNLTVSVGAEVALVHRNAFGTLNNATPPAGVAKIAFDIKNVTLNATRNPVIVFRIMKSVNGGAAAAVTSLPLPTADFTGGPSLYVAYAIPQDGIAAPADFNVYANATLANILANPVGSTTLSSLASLTADASGYFTATLNGTATAPIVVPANGTLVTGVLLGHFTQTAASSGQPAAVNILSRLAMKPLDGTTGRRAVVSSAKCDSCHAQLGTDPSFHSGDRNDPQSCNICHNGNRTSSGWSADSSTFVHGIHAASQRTDEFTWHAVDPDDNYSQLDYPGLLKDCNQCHLPNTVNFAATSPAVPNMLWSTVATGKFVGTAGDVANRNVTKYSYIAVGGKLADGSTNTAAGCYVTPATATSANPSIQPALSVFSMSPYVAKGANTVSAPDYGVGFTTNFTTAATNACTAGGVLYTIAAGGVRQADSTTLVNSPIASACSSCHDSSVNKSHMKQNGGALYATRLSVSDAAGNLVNTETCLTCHGAGKVADAAAMHGAK
jgi:OmcA/MtrC family decaheme c-type cytochrome